MLTKEEKRKIFDSLSSWSAKGKKHFFVLKDQNDFYGVGVIFYGTLLDVSMECDRLNREVGGFWLATIKEEDTSEEAQDAAVTSLFMERN